MVVAADAGMLSASNLKALDELELSFIVGSRVTKAPGDLESHFHWNGDVFTDGQIIDTVTPRHGNTKVNNTALRAEPVWDPEHASRVRGGRSGRIRPNAHAATRRHSLPRKPGPGRSWPATERPSQPDSSRSAVMTAPFDEANLARAQSLVGLKGYVTNVPVTVMPAAEVIAKYHDLWHVEKSFRMSKSDLRARPMFHYTRDGNRSAPDDRVHRPGRVPLHPVAHRTVHRQGRQATTAAAQRDHQHQRLDPDIPASHP